MQKKINTDQAPGAVGPYSQAIGFQNLVFTAGQIPLNLSGEMIDGTIKDKTKQCFENLKAVLAEAGSSLDKVIKVTVFVADIGDFPKINEVYASYFQEPFPARSLVQAAALPKGAEVEIECIAYV